jgi:hypothetical protein
MTENTELVERRLSVKEYNVAVFDVPLDNVANPELLRRELQPFTFPVVFRQCC